MYSTLHVRQCVARVHLQQLILAYCHVFIVVVAFVVFGLVSPASCGVIGRKERFWNSRGFLSSGMYLSTLLLLLLDAEADSWHKLLEEAKASLASPSSEANSGPQCTLLTYLLKVCLQHVNWTRLTQTPVWTAALELGLPPLPVLCHTVPHPGKTSPGTSNVQDFMVKSKWRK